MASGALGGKGLPCLLYTSDAADDLLCVDLGFRRIIKQNKIKLEGCAEAWKRALDSTGTRIGDLSFVETHDCFTIAELIEYEAMGLVGEGQGARAVAEGLTEKNGPLPVNPCLLYTSDAADDLLCVDLGGRRIMKKKHT